MRHRHMRSSTDVSLWASERRGGRYPAGAPTVAVGLAGRLRCDARSAVAPRNSLHSLRSLRSDNRGEPDHEARAARVPTALLRFSPPHKSPPQVPPAAQQRSRCSSGHGGAAKAWVGVRRQRHMRRRAAQGAHGRARQAPSLSSYSSRLFERSERSEWSEVRGWAMRSSSAGTRPHGPGCTFDAGAHLPAALLAPTARGASRHAWTPSPCCCRHAQRRHRAGHRGPRLALINERAGIVNLGAEG